MVLRRGRRRQSEGEHVRLCLFCYFEGGHFQSVVLLQLLIVYALQKQNLLDNFFFFLLFLSNCSFDCDLERDSPYFYTYFALYMAL
jgi:hypothetical protein